MSDGPGEARRRRILFVAEAVTLAHVARPLALADGLDPSRYEVTFASGPGFGEPWRDRSFDHRPIRSISTGRFLGAIASGRPVYDVATLHAYVKDDLALIDEIRPDAVVGDFRLSLSVAARVAKVPYLAITNAYWSPSSRAAFPMPELPLSRALGVTLASGLFHLARPIAFGLHARPLNAVRKAYGMPGLGHDLRRVYTDADWTLYADVPELATARDLPATHRYLGPIGWSPKVGRPDWWDDLPEGRPIVYATPGSSGRPELLRSVFQALADLPVTVLAATAGRSIDGPIPSNVRLAPYLPGAEAAGRSTLVLCNGGSPTTHQALAAGTPVIGLASNMDQHLNMGSIVDRGAGLMIRSERADPATIRRAVRRMLDDPGFQVAATEIAAIFARYDPHARFREILQRVTLA